MLTRREVLSTLWRIRLTILLVMPVADIDHIYYCGPCRIGQYSILYIFGGTQTNKRLLTRLFFPGGYFIEPELYKVQGTGKFCTNQMDHAVVTGKVAQAL